LVEEASLVFVEDAPLVFGEDDGVVLLLDEFSLFVVDDSPVAFFSPFSPSCFDSDLASPSLADVEEAEFDRPPA
jgi:hypothetical protein